MKISDELREWCDVHCDEECGEYLGLLADRIDREMVELPKDANGEVIHVWDTVYTPSGNMADVTSIRFHVMCLFHGGASTTFFPTDLTHSKPDSWERIADDLEKWLDEPSADWDDFKKARDLVDRIRKLAKEDER